MRQGTSEFDQGYHFGRKSAFQFLVDNPKYREIREGELCIRIDTIQNLLNEETSKSEKS